MSYRFEGKVRYSEIGEDISKWYYDHNLTENREKYSQFFLIQRFEYSLSHILKIHKDEC